MDYILTGSSVHGISQTRILEWDAMPSSREKAQPRDRTQVSCIAGGFFTSWATREAKENQQTFLILRDPPKRKIEVTNLKPVLHVFFGVCENLAA